MLEGHRGATRLARYSVGVSRRPPFGLQPRDARWLGMYLGAAFLIFTTLGLAWVFPRLLPIIVVAGLLGAYFLARLVTSFR